MAKTSHRTHYRPHFRVAKRAIFLVHMSGRPEGQANAEAMAWRLQRRGNDFYKEG